MWKSDTLYIYIYINKLVLIAKIVLNISYSNWSLNWFFKAVINFFKAKEWLPFKKKYLIQMVAMATQNIYLKKNCVSLVIWWIKITKIEFKARRHWHMAEKNNSIDKKVIYNIYTILSKVVLLNVCLKMYNLVILSFRESSCSTCMSSYITLAWSIYCIFWHWNMIFAMNIFFHNTMCHSSPWP